MYLIWSILNVALYVYFLYLLVGYVSIGRKVLPKNRFRPLAAILLIVGVVQLLTPEDKDKTNNSFDINTSYAGELSKRTRSVDIQFEDNFSLDIKGWITLAKTSDNVYIATHTSSSLIGFVSGFEWEYKSLMVTDFGENKEGEYSGHGSLKWNLLGVNFYTEGKSLDGTFKVEERK
jgi:hypothetical protein